MSFVDGKVLRDAVVDPQFLAGGLPRFRSTLIGILEGLAVLYRRGLRHGDLGPTNIVLRAGNWSPVIIDLRFSPRFFRRQDNDRCDIRRTVRGMLTNVFDLERYPPPLEPQRAIAHWLGGGGSETLRNQFSEWAAFSDALGPEGRLGKAMPPLILAEAQCLANAQGH